jgi:hypothetical protein
MTTILRVLAAMTTALVLAACAAQSGNVKPATAQSAANLHDPPCMPQTGSRIAAENADQALVASCYSSEDIRRTGVQNSAQALQLLDPAVRIGH